MPWNREGQSPVVVKFGLIPGDFGHGQRKIGTLQCGLFNFDLILFDHYLIFQNLTVNAEKHIAGLAVIAFIHIEHFQCAADFCRNSGVFHRFDRSLHRQLFAEGAFFQLLNAHTD